MSFTAGYLYLLDLCMMTTEVLIVYVSLLWIFISVILTGPKKINEVVWVWSTVLRQVLQTIHFLISESWSKMFFCTGHYSNRKIKSLSHKQCHRHTPIWSAFDLLTGSTSRWSPTVPLKSHRSYFWFSGGGVGVFSSVKNHVNHI